METLHAGVVLIGFMGSGKSSVARRLAYRLGCEYIDLDSRIELAAGQSIAEIFTTQGEAAFRRLETEALKKALATPNIISPGGGTVTQPVNREILKAAVQNGVSVIYLRATPQTLAERIRRQPGKRPLIDGDQILDFVATRRRVEELLAQRQEYYEALATAIVDSDNLSLDFVTGKIEKILKPRND